MCGISGIANCGDRETLARMTQVQAHRGPDDSGIKPFYYFHQGKRFGFASEIKGLLQIPELKVELDPESLHQYLTFLWVPDPKTMFRRIMKLPAGHYAILRNGELRIQQYWDLTFPTVDHRYTGCEADLAEEVR